MPALFKATDFTSLKGQRQYLLAVRLRLVLLVAASAAGSITVSTRGVNWLGFVGAAAFIVAAIVEVFLMRDRPDRRWYEGRAAAESVKTLAWRYAVAAAPFRLDSTTPQETDEQFVERVEEVLDSLDELSFHGDGADQISRAMREARGAPLAVRKAVYAADRIKAEFDWYAERSAWNDRRAQQLTVVIVLFEVLGALGGLLHAVGADVNLLGVAAAAAAALAAWLQTRQHQTLAQAYAVAAQELSSIHSLIRWQETESTWSDFVEDAESAISREHTLWRASRGLRGRVPRETR